MTIYTYHPELSPSSPAYGGCRPVEVAEESADGLSAAELLEQSDVIAVYPSWEAADAAAAKANAEYGSGVLEDVERSYDAHVAMRAAHQRSDTMVDAMVDAAVMHTAAISTGPAGGISTMEALRRGWEAGRAERTARAREEGESPASPQRASSVAACMLAVLGALLLPAVAMASSGDETLCGPRPTRDAGEHHHCPPGQTAYWVCRSDAPEGGRGQAWKWVPACRWTRPEGDWNSPRELIQRMSLGALPVVPPDLTLEADLIDSWEIHLRGVAGVRGPPGPQMVRRYIADSLDPEVSGDDARQRLTRLAAYPAGPRDRGGIWCHWAQGLALLARTLTTAAHSLGESRPSDIMGGLAMHLEGLVRDKCGGGGGRQARAEWERLGRRWTNRSGITHRQATPCIPVPAPGITACAPGPDEAVRLTPPQMLGVAALLAAGFALPAVLGALGLGGVEGGAGLAWASLVAAP